MRRGLKILIAVILVLAVASLISVIHHYQLRNAVNDYIAQLKARGEPMDLAQVIPPPVPPEENGADIFRQAAALIDADDSLGYSNYVYGMEMVAPGKAVIAWRQPDARNVYGTNSWKDIEKAVAQNNNSFVLFCQLISRPNFDFHMKYDLGVADLEFTNLYLAQSKQAAQRLGTAVLCDLNRGETASAVTNLQAMLAIVEAMRDEHLEISALVRIAIANIALTVNWEALQSTNLTDKQLAGLQKDWSKLDFVQGQENALEMERAAGDRTLTKWRNSQSRLLLYLEIPYTLGISSVSEGTCDKLDIAIKSFLWRYWWSYPDQLRSLKGYQVLLETTRSVKTNKSFQTAIEEQSGKLDRLGVFNLHDDVPDWSNPAKTDMHVFLSQSIVALSRVLHKVMSAEVAKQAMVTAIALKRYQLKHGNYPPDLTSLAPEFVPIVPIDPVDGKPLRYRRNDDGTFLLYSIGENGKDDGGNPTLENGAGSSNFYWLDSRALDWVWPQPATAQEIQRFYEQKSKNSAN